jgi:hypothetical protein
MTRFALAFAAALALSRPALAAPEHAPTPAPEASPTVLMLPAKTIVALRQYLGTRPYDETAALISSMEGCAQVQIPVGGVIRSSGQCPEVSAALRAKDAAKPAPAPADEKK